MLKRLTASLAFVIIAAAGCGEEEERMFTASSPGSDPGPVHVHGLGVNPGDRALFIATHTGLFRLARGEETPSRIADRYQDTMGFTIVGPDRFLGSGHPDGREDLPPFLGLIESADAGESWEPVSLLGKADFHVLEAQNDDVYGFGFDWETREPQLLASSDGGETWESRSFPESLLSLAIDPTDSSRLVAGGETSTHLSTDGGATWRELGPASGLLAWRLAGDLFMVSRDGTVQSSDDGSSWRTVGQVGGEPSAFEADREGLYVALHDGTIKQSDDGGRTWSVRFQPPV